MSSLKLLAKEHREQQETLRQIKREEGDTHDTETLSQGLKDNTIAKEGDIMVNENFSQLSLKVDESTSDGDEGELNDTTSDRLFPYHMVVLAVVCEKNSNISVGFDLLRDNLAEAGSQEEFKSLLCGFLNNKTAPLEILGTSSDLEELVSMAFNWCFNSLLHTTCVFAALGAVNVIEILMDCGFKPFCISPVDIVKALSSAGLRVSPQLKLLCPNPVESKDVRLFSRAQPVKLQLFLVVMGRCFDSGYISLHFYLAEAHFSSRTFSDGILCHPRIWSHC